MPNIRRNTYADKSKKVGAAADKASAKSKALRAKAVKKADSNKAKSAKKSARQERRGQRIEARKGLGAGEGKKIIENRATRRKELFNNPETADGKFTKKYEGQAAAGSAAGFQNFVTQADKQAESIDDFKTSLKKSLDTTGDRTDLPSNATSAFMKKRGY